MLQPPTAIEVTVLPKKFEKLSKTSVSFLFITETNPFIGPGTMPCNFYRIHSRPIDKNELSTNWMNLPQTEGLQLIHLFPCHNDKSSQYLFNEKLVVSSNYINRNRWADSDQQFYLSGILSCDSVFAKLEGEN